MTGWLNEFFAKQMRKRFPGVDEAFFIELMKSAREGHLCIERRPPSSIAPQMLYEAALGDFTIDKIEPVVRFENRYYLQRNWVYETIICREFLRLTANVSSPLSFPMEAGLLEAQIKAIEHALSHPLTIISGGPGTGKTYTAGRLIQTLAKAANVKRLYKVYLTAPTGKAAQHLKNALIASDLPISVQADTLHRFLKIRAGESKLFDPVRLDADLIIVDEASMIDVDLWAHLLQAVPSSAKLVLMGDPDQLPPVEAGSIFSDFSDLLAVRLDRCMRTDRKELQELSLAIRRGNFSEMQRFLEQGIGIFHSPDLEALYQKLPLTIFPNLPDPKTCLENFQRFKILGTLRQGPLGIDTLNQTFLERYQKTFRSGHFWAVPILIAVNDPDLGLYNGHSGVLMGPCRRSFDLQEAAAYFIDSLTGEVRSFSPRVLPHYEWGFCLSVHKSQGSEYDSVYALFPEGSERFGKEALYTAVTRAKKRLEIAAKPEILQEMLKQCSRKMSGILKRVQK